RAVALRRRDSRAKGAPGPNRRRRAGGLLALGLGHCPLSLFAISRLDTSRRGRAAQDNRLRPHDVADLRAPGLSVDSLPVSRFQERRAEVRSVGGQERRVARSSASAPALPAATRAM